MLNLSCSSVMASCMGVTYIIDHFLIIETGGSSDHGFLKSPNFSFLAQAWPRNSI